MTDMHFADEVKINRMWKWRRRMAISAMILIAGTGLYFVAKIGMGTIKPELLAASGAFFGWWFGTLLGVVLVYIAGATAQDIKSIVGTKAGGE